MDSETSLLTGHAEEFYFGLVCFLEENKHILKVEQVVGALFKLSVVLVLSLSKR